MRRTRSGRYRGSPLSLTLVMVLVVLSGCVPTPEPEDPGHYQPIAPPSLGTPDLPEMQVQPAFDWSLPPRFGLDANENGLLDLPNSYEYVHNLPAGSCAEGCPSSAPQFQVTLDASESRVWFGGPDTRPAPEEALVQTEQALDEGLLTFSWSITGPGIEGVLRRSSPVMQLDSTQWEVYLVEGVFDVTLTVAAGGHVGTITQKMAVEDLLIASLGDSYASGEGNPERSLAQTGTGAPLWADAGRSAPDGVAQDHARAHRSTLAASAQAALVLEQADPRTSVTFVSFASTGAAVPDLGAQIENLRQIIGCETSPGQAPVCDRQIDALIISVGGNDIGFADVVTMLVDADPVTDPISYDSDVEEAWQLAGAGLAGLPSRYDQLYHMLIQNLTPLNVYLTTYPYPTRRKAEQAGGFLDDQYPICSEIAGDIVWPFEISDEEQWEAERSVIGPLNEAVLDAAAAHEWVGVPILAESGSVLVPAFYGHGYCATSPGEYLGNPFPGHVSWPTSPTLRWIRTATESSEIQGPSSKRETKGTLHPNQYGHQAIKDSILRSLYLPVQIPGVTLVDDCELHLADPLELSVDTPDRVADSIWPFADVDLYQFTVGSRSERWRFEVEESGSLLTGLAPIVQLFGADGAALQDGGTSVEGTFAEPGVYYAGISSAGNMDYDPVTGYGRARGNAVGSYELSAIYVPNHPDSTLSTANPVVLGPGLEGYAIEWGGDVDLFRFEDATRGTMLTIDVTAPGSTGLVPRLCLFDASGLQVAGGEGDIPSALFGEAGPYYLGVSAAGAGEYDPLTGQTAALGNTGPYLLKFFESGDPDDQIEEAVALIPEGSRPFPDAGIQMASGFGIFPNTDVDLFTLPVEAGCSLTMSAEPASGSPGLLLRLFGASGEEMAAGRGSLQYSFGEAGTYFVGVSLLENDAYNAASGLADKPKNQFPLNAPSDAALGITTAYTLQISP